MVIIKYIWIVMLGIGYILWLYDAIKDIRYCRKISKHPQYYMPWYEYLKESTCTFIIINLITLFGFSIMYFILGDK